MRSLTTQLDAEKIRSQSLGKALEDADCDRNTLTANVKVMEETVANLTRQQQAPSATESRLHRQLDDAARSKEQLQHDIAQLRVNSERKLLSAADKVQELESELCIRQEQLKLLDVSQHSTIDALARTQQALSDTQRELDATKFEHARTDQAHEKQAEEQLRHLTLALQAAGVLHEVIVEQCQRADESEHHQVLSSTSPTALSVNLVRAPIRDGKSRQLLGCSG